MPRGDTHNWGGARNGSGRPRGSHSMAPIYREYAEELGIDPVKYMLEVVADKSLEPRMRLDAAKASAPYLASKLRHTEVEVSAPFNGDPATIPTSALIQRILEGRSHEELAEMLLGERGT